MHENWGEKLIISSDFEYVSNILTLAPIVCPNKRSGGCKISSRYFSKMLSIPRYRNYRPIPNKKWANRFNRLEALLLSKSLDQPEPTFQAPKVAPTHPPSVGAVKTSAPFMRPSTDQPASSDLPGTGHSTPQGQATSKLPQKCSSTADFPSTDHCSSKRQYTSKSSQVQPNTSQPSDLSGTGSPALHQVTSKSTSAPAMDQSVSSMDTDSDSDLSDQPPVDIFVEEGKLSDQDPDMATDPDQTLSEDQTYRETLRGIRSYMGWTHIPDMESTTSTGDDNPFAGPKSLPAGKVSVCFIRYPSRSSEAGGLLRDQFVRPQNHSLNGMVYSLTRNLVLLPLETKLLPGVQTPQNLTDCAVA